MRRETSVLLSLSSKPLPIEASVEWILYILFIGELKANLVFWIYFQAIEGAQEEGQAAIGGGGEELGPECGLGC